MGLIPYRLEGNGIFDIVYLSDGQETDNDVYTLDVNQFKLFDGPGDDRYDLVADLAPNVEESISYSDSTGRDTVTFEDRAR